MKLVIAEKPSVARDIANVLGAAQKRNGYLEGSGYLVTWCIGHLVQLANPEEYDESLRRWKMETLPIMPAQFRYEIVSSTKSQFQIVQQLISRSEEIICATDAGREGQLIFEYVLRLSKPPQNCVIRRLWISSMTDEAIRDGFDSLKDNTEYQRLYQSARCRSEADWLVGINFTRLFTIRYGTKLTVGRVQTPTLALIVERQQAIENFQAAPYYQLQGIFGGIRALWHRGNINRLEQKEEALKLQKELTGMDGTVTKLDTSRKNEDRPLLFDLTELQREANRRFGYTAQETLSIAQNLYEKHKFITYPRTDSRYLTTDMKPQIPQLLKKIASVYPESVPFIQQIASKKLLLDKRIINDVKVSDHHAIIVTNNIHQYQPQKLTPRENNVLKLIMIRMIVALSGKKVYDETKLEITLDNQKDIFKATGRIIIDEGWTLVERTLSAKPANQQEDAKTDDKEDKEDDQQILTGIALNQRVHLDKINILEKETTPPKPYTEATLLTAMEKASREIDDKSLKESMKGKGLGTPATRAGIIEKLITVGYVERRKKNLYPTQQGIMFIQLVPESIRQVEMTAQWELQLQEICDGKGNPEQFMQEIRQYVQQTVAENSSMEQVQAVSRKGTLRRVVGKCPKCGQNVIESDKSFYCDGFRMEHKCNFSLWKNNKYLQARGITLTADMAAELLSTGKMQVNNLTSKAGKQYNAIFYMEPGEQYVNFRMEFAPRTVQSSAPSQSENSPVQSDIQPDKKEATQP
ncbi:MAG: DNA topoisomerase 3 [Peptococcaceae bacterium]|nr:DNA topoisomerase 3 [Peptococcaceae bacterium]